jgi:dGTPase
MKNPFPKEFYTKRTHWQKPDKIRGEFFRDQTKIIHCLPFRRLKHKTQVFFAPQNDHICTRIEHVLHVATIAATVCRGLNSSGSGWSLDIEMAYAIGLAHDLGHAPFGHEGEIALNKELKKRNKKFSFIHELNSYRVVEHLINYGRGLNLTYGVKDGILCHNGEDFTGNNLKPAKKPNKLEKIKDRNYTPASYEACIVRLADRIAYLGRDIEDAIKAGFVSRKDLPAVILSKISRSDREINSRIINMLALDLINFSKEKNVIGFSPAVHKFTIAVGNFNYENIYNHPALLGYGRHIDKIIFALFEYFTGLFEKYGYDYDGYKKQTLKVDIAFGEYLKSMKPIYENKKENPLVIITDYISGMTDDFALSCMEQISLPEPISFRI